REVLVRRDVLVRPMPPGVVAECSEGTSGYQLAQASTVILSILHNSTPRALVVSPTMGTLDHVDLELLTALSHDPRATVVALAERLHLSRNTVQARMGKLERAGVFGAFER